MTSTFQEVTKLARDLVEHTKITSRRQAFQSLYNMLSRPRNRQRLADEAPSFKALQSVWELVVNNVILAAQKIDQKRKEGLSLEDITIAFQVIQLADKKHADEVYDLAANHPKTPQEFSRNYRDAFLLGNKMVRKVLNFCFELLDDERACDKAENHILRMVAGMVTQTGYVASFRSESEMQVILEEVEKRILHDSDDDNDAEIPYDVQVTAAEMFRNLLRTATMDLGMDLPVLVASSVKMVASWCARVVVQTELRLGVQNVFLPLLQGICCLIRVNPEQACEPLKRHGRVILKLAKKAYRQQALDRHHRDVVHEYFLCHLLVAQVTGQLQGRLPGDLGDLGDASISLRWIEDTIDLLISRYSDVSDATGSVETCLGENRRRHLELIAHLLSCAQRLYLCQVELETEGLTTILSKVVMSNLTRPHEITQPQGYTEDLPAVAPDIILQSPFWRTIIIPLLCATSQLTSDDLLDRVDDSTRYQGLLEALGKEMKERKTTPAALTRHLLQIVCVCAVIFPAGACWMTKSHSCWYDLPFNDDKHGDDVFDPQVIIPPLSVQGSSPEDLAILLNIIRGIFALHGEMNGDANLQLWTTRTLEYLTRPSSVMSVLWNSSSLHEVQSAWRKVWPVIFRRDLRHHPSTSRCTSQSHGEAVASLVASIARNMSTDVAARLSNNLQLRHTSFLAQRQGDVWNLPLFAKATEENTNVASRIVISLVVAAGLAEGEDSIGREEKEDSSQHVGKGSRRERVMHFFLTCLSWRKQAFLNGSSSSLALLAHGASSTCRVHDIHGPLLELAKMHTEKSITTDLEGELGDLPPVESPAFPFPSTISSKRIERYLLRTDRTASSADLVSESIQIMLVEEIEKAFDELLTVPVDESRTEDDLAQQLLFLEAEVIFLTNSPAAYLRIRFPEFCKKVALCTDDFKTDLLSSTQPSSACFQSFHRVIRGVLLLGAQNDLPVPGCIPASGIELYSELIGIMTCYPQKNLKPSRSSNGASVNFESDDEKVGESEADRDLKRPGRTSVNCSPSKRQKSYEKIISKLDPIDAFFAADIALALRPTPRTLKSVIEALTGANIDRHWVPHAAELDPAAAVYVMQLICKNAVRCDKDELEPMLTLSLELVKVFNKSETATAGKTRICFAFCLRIFQQRMLSRVCQELTSAEATDLLSILTDIDSTERKFRNLRPTSRVGSVQMASSMFLCAGSELRAQWGKTFPSLVLPGLCDSNGLVRRQASRSVSECLTSTANEKLVIDSTLRNTFIDGGTERYREWYNSFSPKLDVTDKQMWEDVLSPVLFSSLLCMALIGGKTNLPVEQASIYFQLVELASQDSKLEGACFLMLEQLACNGGYESVETLTCDYAHDFLLLWFSDVSRRPAISNLPLLLTSPRTIRFLLKTGSHNKLGVMDWERLRSEAASEFAVNSQSLFPILLSTAANPIEKDEGVLDFLSLYDEAELDESSVSKLVRQFVPGICALSVCLKWGSSEEQSRANVLSQRLQEIIPIQKLAQAMKKSASSIVFGIFGWVGSPFIAAEATVADIRDDVLEFVKQFGDVGSRDPFYEVGVSCIELFLFASNKLVRSRRSCRAIHWQRPFHLVSATLLTTLRSRNMRSPPMGFFFFFVSGLLTWDFDDKIVVDILLTAKEALDIVLSRLGDGTGSPILDEARQDLKILIVSIVGLHERNQKRSLGEFRSSFSRQKRFALLSMGVDSHVDENGTISSSVQSSLFFSNEMEHSIALLQRKNEAGSTWSPAVLETTHDFITWAAETDISLGMEWANFVENQSTKPSESSEYALLEKLNKRFCLQSSPVLQAKNVSHAIPSAVLNDIQRLVESMAPAFTGISHGDTTHVSPTRRLLSIHLETLSTSLSGETKLTGAEVLLAVRLFANLCQGLSENIIHTCMGCLGKLRQSLEVGCFPNHAGLEEKPVYTSSTLGNSLLALEAKCVEYLYLLLRTEDYSKAALSCETLCAFLRQRQPTQFPRFIDEKTIRSLEPFFSRKGKSSNKSLTLDRYETGILKQQFGGSGTWVDWCWDESTWKKATTLPFESWICLVVPAMLVCRQETEKPSKPQLEYLNGFQAMARLDAGFASTVFPLCILQYLTNTVSAEMDTNSVESDTWIGPAIGKTNQLISGCFATLLSACLDSRSDDLRASYLVLDTLDLLRSLTLARFLQSENHNPNDRAKRPSQADSPQGSQGSAPAISASTNEWKGVVYGVVLRIDGLLIARACAKVGRYASARLYAEAYADARFGKSIQSLQTMSKDDEIPFMSSTDVSGFGSQTGNDVGATSSSTSLLLQDACNLLRVLRQCSVVDNQTAETSALESLTSDISLVLSNSTQDWYRAPSHLPLDEVRRLGFEGLSEGHTSSIVECLSKLAIPGVVQSFVVGRELLNRNESIQASITDNWFASCLEDPRLFDVDNSHAAALCTKFDKLCGLLPSENTCFDEIFLSGLSSYSKDDVKTCIVRMSASRKMMVEDLLSVANGETTWEETNLLLDRASALNELDALIRTKGPKDHLFVSWIEKQVKVVESASFDDTSTIIAFPVSDFTREVALRAALNRSMSGPINRVQKLSSCLRKFLWQTAQSNRIMGHVDKCEAVLARMRVKMPHENLSAEETFRLGMLEADIQEIRGNRLLAIRSMKQVVQWLARHTGDTSHEDSLAEGLLDLGKRLSAHKAETGEVIVKDYFEPGLSLARKRSERDRNACSMRVLCSGYLALGDLLVTLYQILRSRVSSPEWSKAEHSLLEREKELKEIDAVFNVHSTKKKQTKNKPVDRDLSIYRASLRKEVQNARDSRQRIEKSVNDFLLRATRNIVEGLSIAGTETRGASKFVYRLISIWFSSTSSDISDALQDLFCTAVERIPTYRFVPLTNQIFARLGTTDHFAANLETLARKMCFDHPYQCVVHLVRIISDNSSKDKIQMEKSRVADEILATVKSESTGILLPLVENYEILCSTYIQFASLDPNKLVLDKKRRCRMMSIPSPARIDQCLGKGSRRRPFPPCIVTKPPHIRPDCNYEDVVTVAGFDDTFALADSGLTRPKIVLCLGSDGCKFKQLVKGGDDCRGDAVMEQVFHYVNELFRNQRDLASSVSTETNKIITYNIVPLNPKTGVLEWVENTTPLADYISDNRAPGGVGAHSRYYPGEWGFRKCRDYLDKAPVKDKRKAFEEICQRHSPVFRFFFVERFGRSPQSWYSAKKSYSRSVAVSSFVGHVLGIGDRHGSNILIHKGTGEVVHIDFGIVFEQGKLLNCPERVPFRLTQNIVDGLGPTQHEGIFTSAAESTLSVLRKNADSLLTILSAVVNDPLYKWSVSPMQARRRQQHVTLTNKEGMVGKSAGDSDPEDRNEAASHAIRRVREKLNGYEDGTSGEQQTIEGQVRFLVRAARDLDDLSQMYPGWAPYM